MKILKSDRHEGILSAVPDAPEDLWLLFNFVREGDRVVGRTYRVLRVGSEEKYEKVKKPMTVRISVAKKSLDLPASKLNFTGTIEMAPDDVEGVRGRSHTISVELGKRITVLKAGRDLVAWELLSRARTSKLRVLVLAIEYGNAAVGIFSDSGLLEAQEIQGNISGKENPDERRKDTIEFFKQVASVTQKLLEKADGQMAVVGPGFAKDNFLSFLGDKHRELRSKVAHIGACTSGTTAGLLESIRSGALIKFLRELRFSQESQLIEEILRRLAREPETVALGLDEVSRASSARAVSHLLVLESIPQESEAAPQLLESILLGVQKSGGDITFVSPRHEGGKKLRSLGSIVALLRYPFYSGESRSDVSA